MWGWILVLSNAENNQNETAGGHENTLLFGFIVEFSLAPLPHCRAVLTIFWKD